ncbi:hypothetical protein [Spiribacter vilamensis]|uniref:DUF5666 domain-containing protein n=1 Tax=Spiribacter vilamensis TaxID=531306 RepID=A0A4Q8D005_9GAMM|nr:hypothetical protein [Spiribacter vilamensis]RZU98603.1 hypothetical protein EV698_0857 [Spiribacter vilamensis]TVO60138.1 hypothetical protein FPL09_09910 [Spiribacter vilamensis]
MHPHHSDRRLTGALLAIFLLGLSAPGIAQESASLASDAELGDPTAPPESVVAARQPAGGTEGGEAGAAEGEPLPPPARPTIVVQSARGGDWASHALVEKKITVEGDTIDRGTVEAIYQYGLLAASDNGTEDRPVVEHGVVKDRPGSGGIRGGGK